MSNDYSDQPIDGLENDLLNRGKFAAHLADILLLDHGDDCLTVSLEGKWGDGKTSVINLIKDALKKKNSNSIIVEYNPWLSGSSESLIQDFLLQFSTKLNVKNNAKEVLKIAEELIAYSSLFSVAKLVPGVEPWASIVEKVFSWFGSAAKKIAKIKELDVLGKKEKVIKALKKIETPIVVIIDDIDRLTPQETFQVLRLVKAVADFPGVSFLLAFDPHYLVPALNKNDIIDAHEYINKVIQLRAPLPVISNRGMEEMLYEKLIALLALIEKTPEDIFNKSHTRLSKALNDTLALLKNPRDLKRLFNHLRLVVEQVKDQVDFVDLFVLSLIATKANFIYEFIKKNPLRYAWDSNMRDKDKSNIELNKLFKSSSLSVSDRGYIEMLILEIFPLPAPDPSSSSYSFNGTAIDFDGACRVSMPQRLYTALHYGTPVEYVSDSDVLEFILGKSNRQMFLKKVLESKAEIRFIEVMALHTLYCKEHSFEVLKSIYIVFDSLEIDKSLRRATFVFAPLNSLTEVIIDQISDLEQKFELIFNLMEINKSAKTINNIDIRTNRYNSWMSELSLRADAFEVLKGNSCFKEYLSNSLNQKKGVVAVARMMKNSVNNDCIQVNDKNFPDLFCFKNLKQKAEEVSLFRQSIDIQAVLKSMQDGKKYCLKTGQLQKD